MRECFDSSSTSYTHCFLTIYNSHSKILDAPLSQETSIADPSSISHIMASAFQIDNIVSMLKSLTSVAVEFQDRYKQFATSISSKLSRGFASIPDELLPIIFEFAVRAEGRMGARQAVRLSHVSRHFRDIALAERSLWSTIHIRSRAWNLKEELETIISRSGGNTDFNVFVDIDPDEFHIGKDNIVVFAATSSRWRTLSLTECDRKWYEEELVGVRNVSVDSILQMFFHTGVVQLPHLQELSIRSEDSRRSLSTISCQWGVSESTFVAVLRLYAVPFHGVCFSDGVLLFAVPVFAQLLGPGQKPPPILSVDAKRHRCRIDIAQSRGHQNRRASASPSVRLPFCHIVPSSTSYVHFIAGVGRASSRHSSPPCICPAWKPCPFQLISKTWGKPRANALICSANYPMRCCPFTSPIPELAFHLSTTSSRTNRIQASIPPHERPSNTSQEYSLFRLIGSHPSQI